MFSALIEFVLELLKWEGSGQRLRAAGTCFTRYLDRARHPGDECGQVTLAAAVVGLLAVWGADVWQSPGAADGSTPHLRALLRQPHWIAYDPRDWNPVRSSYPSIRPLLTRSSICADLDALQQAGFTGVVLFTCNGPLAMAPELAKQRRMAVIVGVWNPRDAHELGVAIQLQPFADAYSIGHGGLARGDYTADELRSAMARVRRRTGRPVSTCEPYDTMFQHLGDPESAAERMEAVKLGDWLFPDLGRTWAQPQPDAVDTGHVGLEPGVAVVRLRAAITRLKRIAIRQGQGKPLLLHMLCYPAGGFASASEASQLDFFQQLLASPEMSLGDDSPPFVVMGAFPAPWKAPRQFAPWDAENSLFRDDRIPRPAVRAIVPSHFQPSTAPSTDPVP